MQADTPNQALKGFSVSKARWLSLILAMAILLTTVSGVAGQRPNGHRGASGAESSPESEANSETSDASGCERVETYYDRLWTAMEDSGVYIEFLLSDSNFGDLTQREAEEIIAEGENLITTVETLDVPAAYTSGHEGILLFLKVNSDIARFYALDSSIVPDLNAFEEARLMIYEGEIALLEACPDEMDAIGGYIMFDPMGIVDEGNS